MAPRTGRSPWSEPGLRAGAVGAVLPCAEAAGASYAECGWEIERDVHKVLKN